MNIYKNSVRFPYHLSVGVVLINKAKQVCCELYPQKTVLEITGHEREIYTLIRETVETGEDLESAAIRGVREEIGIQANLIGYLGSQEDLVEEKDKTFTKTTVYFLAELQDELNLPTIGEDDTVKFKIIWLSLDEAISFMQKQSTDLTRRDLNESKILERAKKILATS